MKTTLDDLVVSQHLVLSSVSWAYYEHTLEQVGDRPIRVSFLDGQIEIMSPLPEEEVFPFLHITEFARFITPMVEDDETPVLKEFRGWLRTLPAR